MAISWEKTWQREACWVGRRWTRSTEHGRKGEGANKPPQRPQDFQFPRWQPVWTPPHPQGAGPLVPRSGWARNPGTGLRPQGLDSAN